MGAGEILLETLWGKSMKRVAIIGAGLSGLVLAHALSVQAQVVVFEKARGAGGRMSTRYADPFYFDHGTQFFTARTDGFRHFLQPHIDSGTVAEWKGKVIGLKPGAKETKGLWFEPHWVASPNMNSLCKALASGIDVRAGCEIAPLAERSNGAWLLHDIAGNALGTFDWVISTAPPQQTERLFGTHLPAEAALRHVQMQGCYALMLGFHHRWNKSWIAAKIEESPLAWVAVNSTKPGRNDAVTSIVVQTSHDWAELHIDDDVEHAQTMLVEALARATGIDASAAEYISTHRWRYAIVDPVTHSGPYLDTALKLAATGDWCGASRIEEVWAHAQQLADQLLRSGQMA